MNGVHNCNCCTIEMYNNIKKNGNLIKKVDNPCLEIQFLAVSENGLSIQYICDQNITIQLVALHQNIKSIMFFKNDCISKLDQDKIDMAFANQYHKQSKKCTNIPLIYKKTILYLQKQHIYSQDEFTFK